MLKSGIPPPAVRHKMTLDGIPAAEQDKFFGVSTAPSPSQPAVTIPTLPPPPPQLPPHLRKYQVMLKSGVPQGAVNHKMVQENVCQKDRNLVLGIQEETTEKPSAVSVVSTPVGPKFIGLHWDPIHVNDLHVIQRSIWGEIHTEEEHQSSLQLAQEEYSRLSSLFAKRDKSSELLEGQDGNDVQEELMEKKKPILKRKSSMPTTIDMSRSTNISIGLSSFKQKKMTIEMVNPLLLLSSSSFIDY